MEQRLGINAFMEDDAIFSEYEAFLIRNSEE